MNKKACFAAVWQNHEATYLLSPRCCYYGHPVIVAIVWYLIARRSLLNVVDTSKLLLISRLPHMPLEFFGDALKLVPFGKVENPYSHS